MGAGACLVVDEPDGLSSGTAEHSAVLQTQREGIGARLRKLHGETDDAVIKRALVDGVCHAASHGIEQVDAVGRHHWCVAPNVIAGRRLGVDDKAGEGPQSPPYGPRGGFITL